MARKARSRKPNTEPKLTRLELARALKCDPRTVAKWIEEGLPIFARGRGGRASLYSERAVREWLEARNAATEKGDELSPSQEKARRDHWQAILAEETVLARRKLMLPAADIEKLWAAEVTAVRARLIAIPTTWADRIHRAGNTDGVRGVERVLREAIHNALRELSTGAQKETAA